MEDAEKITIIEGPTPTFEWVNDAWLFGLTEGPAASQMAICRLRAVNGRSLVERCYRTWHRGQTISLEYRGEDGLPRQAPIVAVRTAEVPEGPVLQLWVRLEEGNLSSDMDVEIDELDDDFDENVDEDPDLTI
jgi:hypothetical protein